MIYKAVSIKKAKINMDFFTFFSQMEPIINTTLQLFTPSGHKNTNNPKFFV